VAENRAEWQNFVNSADIEPLGRAYGYQQEIPFEGRGRIDRFFEDPRNIRGLIGEITQDPSGNPRGAAVRTKRALQANPQFLRDVDLLMSRSPRSTIAGIEDAYALRQLFGEAPNQYGSENPDTSTERRGITLPSTGQRVRVTERGGFDPAAIPTNELSPFERTRQTASSLRPSVLAEDLAVLGDPEVLAEANVSPDSPSEAARRLLYETISQDAPNTNTAISLDAQRNADDEALRRLVTRNNLGQIEIGGDFPGQFAYDLTELLGTRGADPDYILEYLQNSGELPDEASYPEPEEFDYDSEDPESRRIYGTPGATARELNTGSSDLENLRTWPSASGGRLNKNALLETYGSYIPSDYKKIPAEELNKVINELNSKGNPDVQEYVYKTLAAGYVDKAEPVSNLERMLQFSKNIANPEERTRVTNYLENYLQNIEDKFVPVSPRAAGVGGGKYLNPAEVSSLYPSASEKLDVLGDTPYVPDDFEPVIQETFYSGSRPYKVTIERDAASLPRTDINENFIRLIDEKPFLGVYDIGFKVNGEHSASQNLPEDIKGDIQKFVRENSLRGIPAGALVKNTPLGNEIFRKGPSAVNKRALAYQQSGFGARTQEGQYSYVDPETGGLVPVQPFRGRRDLRGVEGERAYYSLDPVTAPATAIPGILRSIKRTPASLLPGAADLIPSPEAIQTGYAQGPAAMGKQMAQEFVQGLPSAAGYAMLLSSPVGAPLAPGIGAGMVGTAGARALNEVVRQETGEGIVPKVRQFLGTAPRTGAAAQPRVGEQPLTATVKPLTTAQRTEVKRQANRNELQRRVDLLKERFNPQRGEFGLSEILFGR